ncbi:MAG: enolase C-terminal domain-like protein, partial [Candidatus Latescibacteria bacterium]|nr:enolase C-terminal domain-like protein [Candidatus Latescibacterota bacterium]
ETLDNAADALADFSYGDLPSFDPAKPWRSQMLQTLAPVAAKIPSAAFAIETAWLDLCGRSNGASVASLLAASDTVEGRTIEVNGVIERDELSRSEAVELAENLVDEGINRIKIKIGPPFSIDEDVQLLTDLRRRFGDKICIRLDANGGWSLGEAQRALDALCGFDIDYCEQPVSTADLPRFSHPTVPLAADESLRDLETTAELLGCESDDLEWYLAGESGLETDERNDGRSRACSVFVLKPMVSGGVLRCERLAAAASKQGIGVVVTHLFDGPVAHSACCEFAASLAPPPLPCGLAQHRFHDSWATKTPHIGRAMISSADRHGLGINLKSVPR